MGVLKFKIESTNRAEVESNSTGSDDRDWVEQEDGALNESFRYASNVIEPSFEFSSVGKDSSDSECGDDRSPFEIYESLDLGEGGYIEGSAEEHQSELPDLIRDRIDRDLE